jgi:hypothetical protein
VTNFGWTGEREEAAGQGWGVSWQCPDCRRVVVGHVLGVAASGPTRARIGGQRSGNSGMSRQRRLGNLERFRLRVEMPQEFKLERAKLVTGRIDLDGFVTHARCLAFASRDERLAVSRFSLASLVLSDETLSNWTDRIIKLREKRIRYGRMQESEVVGHPGVKTSGKLRDSRRFVWFWLLDWLLRRPRHSIELRVWHCEAGNKLYHALGRDAAKCPHRR